MSDHVFSIRNRATMGGLVLICSCGNYRGPVFPRVDTDLVRLDEINRLAHDHIESSERVGEVDAVTTGHGGYRVESLVRSADELIDLEHP